MTLHDIGHALYGPHWQTPLADALGVSARTVRRWAAGGDPPERVWADIARLAEQRGLALIGMASDVWRTMHAAPCELQAALWAERETGGEPS